MPRIQGYWILVRSEKKIIIFDNQINDSMGNVVMSKLEKDKNKKDY